MKHLKPKITTMQTKLKMHLLLLMILLHPYHNHQSLLHQTLCHLNIIQKK